MHPFRSVNTIRATPMMLVVACVCSQLASAQSDLAFEPYPVFVVQEQAYARCGPSDEYYRTDPLRHGQEVEVYAETDDGWLGIRPPADSFCWVPAETVEMKTSGQSGIVIEDRTVAWIGTHLGRARTYRWQVQLAEGEPVTVIGRSEREGPDGPQLWFRIVPPSGEYRWVHRDHVVTSSEELVASIRRQSGRKDTQDTAGNPKLTRSVSPPNSNVKAELRSTGSSRRNSPKPRSVASAGRSILESKGTVGSGLNPNWQPSEDRQSDEDSMRPRDGVAAAADANTLTEAMKQGGLLASVEFLTRPRLIEIGSAPSAPSSDETAADANWVAGVRRAGSRANERNISSNVSTTPFVAATGTTMNGSGSIMQASGRQRIAPATSMAIPARQMNPLKVVSAERIAQIEAETRGADFERLSLLLSRLMATQATAAETEPLARAAASLASTSLEPVARGRARLLAERAEQYRRVAIRRDGESVIRGNAAPMIPSGQAVPNGSADASARYGDQPGVETSMQTGYLVQVYSARSNSPPFALTDNTGRTVAYVTPSPGVNLRVHLNSKVRVSGNPGFLTGLNTPHILATQAIRTPE